MRELGCTRVELGVQAVDDKILAKNKRGHGVDEIITATKMLKENGFKITYHIMPGLPGSGPKKDLEMFKKLFSSPDFQPDQIKFYPTVVTRGSLLYRWWKQGKYKPYSDKVLQDLIIKCKQAIPRYVRIIRLIRDIPGESIVAGNMITNLRQVMADKGVKCNCIRCRQAKEETIKKYYLHIKEYKASAGKEFFISAENKDRSILYGFCRLRLNGNDPEILSQKALGGAALIRELHVYGELATIGRKGKIQHIGLGKKMLQQAEQIAKKEGRGKIAVISGAGVRNYYRRQGYRLIQTYMVKSL
jgi:elongator complex protein 3